MRPGDKTTRHVGDLVTCACEGCSNRFELKIRAMHKLYCSKRCRDMATRMALGRRPDTATAKGLRKLSGAAGGTESDGAMVSGTLAISMRPVIDLSSIPQDRPELWA